MKEYLIRPISEAWVHSIKDSIKMTPTSSVTRLPVLLDPIQITSMEDFSPEILENDNVKLITLGGNHLTTAIQELLHEERQNSMFDCLREIDIELFIGLTVTEGKFIASIHNQKSTTKEVLFQEKIAVCREIYNIYGETEENWKELVAASLGYLLGQTVKKDSISTILAPASYDTTNYELAARIFDDYRQSHPDKSFPQLLFRRLLGISEKCRTPYLSRSIGTNGLKQARQVQKDICTENLKNLFVRELEVADWAEAEDIYPDETIELMEFADMEVTTKKVPIRILDFLKKVKTGQSQDQENEKEMCRNNYKNRWKNILNQQHTC
ncbi:uncharacterized protein LOC123541849 [Mercenaria mercenaria]|uniref:uncharacterized protein LOC123541849 n=1 Tax=Mercenaria mercenaria TaxID=6596 RepID=UPI00234F4697|nr:uncharacterized protein LOC123541849 [Mercenaria mercenaria]